jgi:type I restriction-modification system DNA methylase subunit/restriction endonuclease S subunit
MITKDNFKKVLEFLGFKEENNIFSKKFESQDCELKADFQNEILIYPENKGFTVNERQTCNFKANENFVVFESVYKLLNQGYNPAHIELEPKWQVGHGASGGRADILVKDNDDKSLLIIECKTAGSEFSKAWNTTQTKPTQLFSYVQQTRTTKFIALYASDFVDNQVVSNYYLINVSDNDELLKNNPKLQSFKFASTVEEIYKVWVDTYGKDFATLGLFEDNKAYDIGKTKFTSIDLKNINSKDIQGKYHEFATILRQHNVSGRENAFDKLVNLFLCKVTDEKENKDELKFYWKGRAYDNPFDFQDRLQQLYKNGMEKFLGETITYIDNNQIDEAFEVFKNKPNTTKDKIKEFLKAQKFFTNNDFAFIDVHNEKLFYQNFEVLLKISRLIQDISLTGSDENQFLGDMFEGFLDQGVKQSEGQFFTPMPIVKFIINSLPQKENPKVIDYACGAGHFLNEYAGTNKEAKIIGIEKEYRLSKVAKVSSFMYGSEIDIIYEDALKMSEKVKESSFDVLVANPPYSVKGFLETLSDDDRIRYELLETVEEKSYTANNAIECFFIERAKQLLSRDAVAGIVVPSSILNKGSQSISTNKGNVYVGTREILLKYFDIVAIAEFGSGTFGKTGTNTVTLFLKRRGENPNLAEHFKNMVECWFECDFETNKAFEDDGLLEQYCSHIEVDFEIYKTLLCQNLDETLFEKDTFKEYKNEFEKLTDTKNRRKTKTYTALTTEQKEEIEKSELVKYIRLIEKDKFYYFCLAFKNSCDVVIVKSPSDGKENKKFLGYEWSSAKGNEGIHYLSSSVVAVEDESLDEEDKRILENLAGLKSINTPLYNPQNSDDTSKINKIIKDNFDGIKTIIPTELEPFVSRAKLIDMLDFSRVDFNKAIGLNPNKKVEIIGKAEWQRKLGDVVEVLIGGTPSRANSEYFEGQNLWVSISEMNGQIINDTKEKISDEGIKKSNVKLIPKGTTLLSFKLSIGKTAIAGKDLYTNEAIAGLIPKTKELRDDYLFHLFNGKIIDLEKDSFNTFGKSLNSAFLKNEVKIPLPPLEIQEEIVKECQKVDDEILKANETIEQIKKVIENEINSINGDMVKLEEIVEIQAGGTPKREITEYWNGDINWLRSEVCQNNYVYENQVKEKITSLGLKKSSAKLLKKDTVLIALVGATIGKVGFLTFEATTNQNIAGLYPKNKQELIPQYLYYQAINLYPEFMKLGEGKFTMANLSFIKNLKITIPNNIEIQKQIVSKIEVLENKISEAKKVIDGAKEHKEEILRKYL